MNQLWIQIYKTGENRQFQKLNTYQHQITWVFSVKTQIHFQFVNLLVKQELQHCNLPDAALADKSQFHYIRSICVKRRKHITSQSVSFQGSKMLLCPVNIQAILVDLIIHELMSSKQVIKGGQVRRFYRYISHEFFMSDNISLSCNFVRYISLKLSYCNVLNFVQIYLTIGKSGFKYFFSIFLLIDGS